MNDYEYELPSDEELSPETTASLGVLFDAPMFDGPAEDDPSLDTPSVDEPFLDEPSFGQSLGHSIGRAMRDLIQIALLVILLRVGLDVILPRYVVDGASMQPNFYTSQRVVVDRLTMLLEGASRGDVVVLDSPTEKGELLIKRVIGLPNETVTMRDGRVSINGQLLEESYISEYCTSRACNGEWILGPDEYFVLGDNRPHSYDSQDFGPVKASTIKGIVRLRYWPLFDASILTAPDY